MVLGEVLLPYKITLLSNAISLTAIPIAVLLPYEITLLSNLKQKSHICRFFAKVNSGTTFRRAFKRYMNDYIIITINLQVFRRNPHPRPKLFHTAAEKNSVPLQEQASKYPDKRFLCKTVPRLNACCFIFCVTMEVQTACFAVSFHCNCVRSFKEQSWQP